jgi:hypothetical protein
VAKLLIDECLHTSLLGLAHTAGHSADHVNYLGLDSSKDWELMTPRFLAPQDMGSSVERSMRIRIRLPSVELMARRGKG